MPENSNRFVLKNVVINYPSVFRPKSINGSPAKYSACLLIGKDDLENLNAYQSALEAAYEAGKGKLMTGKALPKLDSLRCPLKDGDLEKPGDEAYEDRFFLNASSRTKPKAVRRDLSEITEEDELYSGCIVNVSVTLYVYKTEVSKGIACGLNSIQLVKRGERIGRGPRITDEFEVIESEDEDDLPF